MDPLTEAFQTINDDNIIAIYQKYSSNEKMFGLRTANKIFTNELLFAIDEHIDNQENIEYNDQRKQKSQFEFTKIINIPFSLVDNVTTRLNNIEEACRNDFGNISSEFTSSLRNEVIQRYAITQRLHHSSSSEMGDTMDYAFETVRREIRELTGEKIGKGTVKSFYYGEGDPKFNTVMSIMRW
ncbi:hypothetical protein RhiirA5_501886 [Rhizophagus irregularis]|uniref:Uncharacterized protein n=1 Tax=Rhizophagus irregularis TaxID=588596 RepID=A0A2I1E6K4_9GLOM|nr:hypothetical protein RhiirA5_501886 [Rhizophagus irregularis]PKY17755.1 hypothetical protein RhiirB3_522225 [Rhizophagus irregularis]